MTWAWADWAPYYAELTGAELTPASSDAWLQRWSALSRALSEVGARRSLAHQQNTQDAGAAAAYHHYVSAIQSPARAAEQALKEKLLAAGFTPLGMEIPLRNLRAEADLYRAANLPLLVAVEEGNTRYEQILGAQSFDWEDQTYTFPQLRRLLQNPDRAARETIWRRAHLRALADRPALNHLWGELFELRRQIAANADLPDYRAYAWREKLRFDYTPADAARFHAAILEVCTPAAERILRRRQRALGLDRLRPWDLKDGWYTAPLDPPERPALRPFQDTEQLAAGVGRMFDRLDPTLGAQFAALRAEGLLDLANRPHKAPGAFCTQFAVTRRPFIFANAVGLQRDVQTLLHESGHAFHVFARLELPYFQQARSPMEFNEVASMAMELLAAPYLTRDQGGFYAPAEAARARREHLEDMILFWPFMAVVDGFQHWAYTHPEAAIQPAACDATWRTLWARYLPAVDWDGLEDECATGWQRKLHIFEEPFYYIEYGLASLGAAQIWVNAQRDPAQALAAYRRALALGGTVTLPELYQAAGGRLAFDAAALAEVVDLMEIALADLD
jgi:oligoendopeptidase F